MPARPADMDLLHCWTHDLLAAPTQLPFSLTCGGLRLSGMPPSWHATSHRRRLDANLVETVHEGTDPKTGLRVQVEVLQYLDFPVVEWVVWLENTGPAPTPLLEDLCALDAAFTGAGAQLWHCNGDFYSETGYTPEETPLPEGQLLTFAPSGGRPCDGAFPYFRVEFADRGLTLAVGWPGQWSATFTGEADAVAITAGQQLTRLVLQPGERLRTPRVTLQAWEGDRTRAVNLWRQWYLAHVLPRPDGRPLQPLLVACGPDDGEEFTATTEENQLRHMDSTRARDLEHYDIWWIDAGWYPCMGEDGARHWPLTGSWVPDPERYPRGLAPVARRVREAGAELLVWFEPERVTRGSVLWNDHPDWLLRNTGPDGEQDTNALLNLGHPECRQWLTDHVCGLIRRDGIGVYRQDFNFAPLGYWRGNDAPDRQGMCENLHVQGYLQYWDDLLARNPGLWIDSCSSGGRRNDLETMRRSVPLHYTDYGYGDHKIKLAFHHTLFAWLPYFKECTLSWDEAEVAQEQIPPHDGRFNAFLDSFSFHCAFAAMLSPGIDIRREDVDLTVARQMIEAWRRAAPSLLYGDYYPLTPPGRTNDAWVAWQFDRSERGEGFLQAIRLAECPQESYTLVAQGLAAEAEYVLENPENGEQQRLTGAVLRGEGLTVNLPARSGVIWFYRRA